jgi:O-antigen/teichoic acid export membrane protein
MRLHRGRSDLYMMGMGKFRTVTGTDLIRLARSATFISMLSTILKVGAGVLTLPLALRLIPQDEMGLYYTFWGMAGLVMVFDFGFAQAITRNAAYVQGGARRLLPIGPPEPGATPAETAQLLITLHAAGRLWYACSGTALAALLLVPGTWLVESHVQSHAIPGVQASSWILFALAVAANFYCSYLNAFVMGLGKVREASLAVLGAQVVGMLVLVGTLLAGGRLWAFALSQTAVALTLYAINHRTLTLHLPPRGSVPDPQFSTRSDMFKTLWPMVWRYGAVIAGAYLIQKTNILICGKKLGLEATASYGLTLSLFGIIVQICLIPMQIANPRISALRVSGDIEGIRQLFFKRVYLSLGLGLLGTLALTFLGPWMLTLVGSKTSLLPTACLLVLGLIWLLECHHGMYASLVLSENRNPFILPALLSGVAVVIISWMTVDQFGIWALILSQGLVQLCWNNWWTVWRGLQGLKKPLAP